MNYLAQLTSTESQPSSISRKIVSLTQPSSEFQRYLRSRLISADLRRSRRILTAIDPAVIGEVKLFEN